MSRIVCIIAAGFVLSACGGGEKAPESAASTPAAAPASDVDKALAVQRGIEAAPDKADSVLAANGLTAGGFDSLMYSIAADSAKRAAFTGGR